MEEIKITNKRFVSSDSKFNHYIVSINSLDVRVHEDINGNGFGFNMLDLTKAFNYERIEDFQASKEWEQFSIQISSNTKNTKGNNKSEKVRITKMSDIVGKAQGCEMVANKSLEQKGSAGNNYWREWAGMNGAIESGKDVVFYAGGSLDRATEGTTPILFRANGSGHVANQNISWDEFGNLLVRGTFESNKDENRIVIDPSDRSIKLYNNKNQLMYNLTFSDYNGYVPRLSIWERNAEGKAIGRTIVEGGSYRVDNLDIMNPKYIEVTPDRIRLVDGTNDKSITAKD